MKKLLTPLFVCILAASCQIEQPEQNLVLNEICGKDADGLEWVEIGNPSDHPINLCGYSLRKIDDEGMEKKIYEFPDTTLLPGQLYMVNDEDLRNYKNNNDRKGRIPWRKAFTLELEDPQGNIIDTFDTQDDLNLSGHPKGQSYARQPNLTGAWTLSNAATWNQPNSEQSSVTPGFDDEFDEDLEE